MKNKNPPEIMPTMQNNAKSSSVAQSRNPEGIGWRFFSERFLLRKKYYPVLDGAEPAIHKIVGGAFGAFPNAPLLLLFLFSLGRKQAEVKKSVDG